MSLVINGKKPKPIFKNLDEKKLSVNEAIQFTSVFLNELVDYVSTVDFSSEDEINELKSYVYATRMYYIKTLQIIDKSKRSSK